MRVFLNDLREIWARNGVNSVALVHRQKVMVRITCAGFNCLIRGSTICGEVR